MFCLQCGTEFPDGANRCTACGWELGATTPMAAAMPQSGNEREEVARALAGEYEIAEEIGRGGMAIVYRAVERALDREVAIKVLPFTFAFDNDFVERFQREARTAARLEHPHIIPIYRVGRSGNVIYFTMKFLRGDSLARVVAYRGALKPHEIRRLLREAGGALGYAHKHGVVHRDVKPDNIMFHESGHAVMCDFGIAKAASESKLTGTGTAIGTPHYMSPEQARAQPLDGRSDLYSLGVVAYKCLTGRVPFDAEDSYAIGIKHITEALPEPTFETQDQRDLFSVVARLLEKAPEDRFSTAAAMIDAVEALDVTHGKGAVVVTTRPSEDSAATEVATVASAAQTPTTPMPRSSVGHGPSPRRRKALPALAGALVLAVGIGGGIIALTRGGDEPVASASPPAASPQTVAAANAAPAVPSDADREIGVETQVAREGDPPPGVGSGEAEEGAVSLPGATTQTPAPSSALAGAAISTGAASPVGGRAVGEVSPPSVDTARVGAGGGGGGDSLRAAGPAGAARPTDSAVVRRPPARPTLVAPRDTTKKLGQRPVAGAIGVIADSLRARAVEEGMGRLEIRGVTTGSHIYIGDQEVRGLGHNLPAGTHVVRVTRPGYENFVERVVIVAGKVARLRVRQRRTPNPG